jgi:four helix bundle protein
MANPRVRSHHDLIVWQKAMRLYVGCWRLARLIPWPERDDLGPQLRRASLSIPCNIAEGFGRDHLGDYLHHLSYAKGSSFEVDSQLLGVRELHPRLASEAVVLLDLDDEVGRMITGLARELRPKQDDRRRSR